MHQNLSTNPPDGSCRARNILPTHLPVDPRGNVFPKSRPARIRYFAACNAWTGVEWIIAAHNYELGCLKSPAEYEKGMGGWKISRVQRDLVLDLFKGLTPFLRLRSNGGWSRGRKSLHEKLVNLTHNAHIHIGGTVDTSHVAATGIVPDMICMPSNAGVLDPCDYLTPLQKDIFRTWTVLSSLCLSCQNFSQALSHG